MTTLYTYQQLKELTYLHEIDGTVGIVYMHIRETTW